MNLLLVGGGHAMLQTLEAAGSWSEAGLQVTLLNPGRHLYYSGMIPEYLGGVYAEEDVRIDLERLCSRNGIRFVDGRAIRIDRRRRLVVTADDRELPYDAAAFDVGGINPGRPEPAIPTKPLRRIQELERRLRTTLDTPSEHLRLAIAGGGAAGVEIALNISGRFLGRNRMAELACTLVEPADRLLASFPKGMSRYAREVLVQRGVRVLTGTGLTWDGSGAPSLDDGTKLNVDEVVWATGTSGLPLFRDAGLSCDERGFVRVSRSLRVLDDPRLFAAGDCASPTGLEHLRKVGVHAIKQGATLRDNLHATLAVLATGHEPFDVDLTPFRPYPIAPLILSTGAKEGLWTAGPLWLRGRFMLRLKHLIDRRWIRPYQRHNQPFNTRRSLLGAEAACQPSG